MSEPNLRVKAVVYGLVLVACFQPVDVFAQFPDSLDAESHRQVLVEVAEVIRNNYADPKVGNAMADSIMASITQGRADASIPAQELVATVMGVIRSMVADRHFELSDRLAERDDSNPSSIRNRSKHGLRSTRTLEGKTVCFEFDGFPGDEASVNAVTRAIEEQAEMRAVIFDLRDNNGGAGDMVVMLLNHLLEADLLLYTYAGRSHDTPAEMRSSNCERRFDTSMPVYILTSASTLSAAEAFTYILQDFGRAVVVGERTAGMANPSRTFSIADRFDLTVPFLILRYGKSGGTFAGTGVTPDIEVPAESALETALERLKGRD